MTTNEQNINELPKDINPSTCTGRLAGGKTATGYRVVHVAVPNEVFNHAKAQSFLLGLPWSHFITETLKHCEQLIPRQAEKEEK